jgi:hypothetical protein
MASWQVTYGPGTKPAVTSQLNAATISQISGFDPGVPLNEADTTLAADFTAVITAAKGLVAALLQDPPRKDSVTGQVCRALRRAG